MSNTIRTNILIMGSGAVGCAFGAKLENDKNNNVFFIARGLHLEALKSNGLTLRSNKENLNFNVNASDNPSDFNQNPNLILLTLKSFDTDLAISQLKSVVSKKTQILSLQNGIENYPKLINAFGEERVVRGFCGIHAEITNPGVIRCGPGYIFIGENIHNISERIKWIQSLFTKANIKCNISKNIEQDVWRKYAWNCIFNIVTTIEQITISKIFDDPEKIQLCKELFREIQLVARSQGVILDDKIEKLIFDNARNSGDMRTSTLQDRLKGKRMEYETFTGFLIRLAKKHKIHVPTNRIIYEQLKKLDNH